MTEQNKYSTTPRDYNHVGPMPQSIATGKYLGKVDSTSQLLARDIRNFAWAEDTQESIARFIEWCSILYNFTADRNDNIDFSVGQMNTMFSDVIKELSKDKDYYSLPEIAGARRGYDTLYESLQNLSPSMLNPNLGKLTQLHMSDELLAQIAGNAAVNAVPADGSLTTSKYASGSVTSDKIDRAEVKGNLYDYRTHLIQDYLVNVQGVPQALAGWSYGRVPINGSGIYSIWMPSGDYSGNIGALGLYNGTNQVEYIYAYDYKIGEGTVTAGGVYEGANYITITVPEGVDSILVTNKKPEAFDYSQNMIVVEGDRLNDTILSAGVSKLFGVPLIDEEARAKLNDVEISGGNLYNSETDYTPGYYIGVDGLTTPVAGWGYARVPISSGGTYSLWLEHANGYGGHIGSIGLYNGNTRVDYIYVLQHRLGEGTAGIGGQYKGSDYITFTVPEGITNIRVTNKRGGSSLPFDDSETMILIEGDTINDSVLGTRITKLFGYPMSNDITLPYEGKKWVVVGDSLTEINSRSTKFYHQYVADDLGITVHNMGQSGTGYKRSNPFYDRVSNIPTDADVVTIFGSFNDLGAGVPLGTKDDTGTDTLGGAINTTIDNLYAKLPTVPLGIISPTPWHTSQPWNDEHTTSLYVKLLKDICKDRGIPFLDLYYSSGLRPWDANYRPLMYSRDDGSGTHPDENGHKLIYPQFREFIKTLI